VQSLFALHGSVAYRQKATSREQFAVPTASSTQIPEGPAVQSLFVRHGPVTQNRGYPELQMPELAEQSASEVQAS
jgi:hypothetical protein